MIWSRTGGWQPEEEALLLECFGDDVTVDLVERSSVDARVLLIWVEWDRLPSSIYVISFQQLNERGLPLRHEFLSLPEVRTSPEWGRYFPAPAPLDTERDGATAPGARDASTVPHREG